MCGIHLTNTCNFEEPYFQKIRNEMRNMCHRYGAKRSLSCTCAHWKNTKRTYGPKSSKLKTRVSHILLMESAKLQFWRPSNFHFNSHWRLKKKKIEKKSTVFSFLVHYCCECSRRAKRRQHNRSSSMEYLFIYFFRYVSVTCLKKRWCGIKKAYKPTTACSKNECRRPTTSPSTQILKK